MSYAAKVTGKVLHPSVNTSEEASLNDLMGQVLQTLEDVRGEDHGGLDEEEASDPDPAKGGVAPTPAPPAQAPSSSGPSFMPPAREVNRIVQQHQQAVESTQALRKALNALGAQSELVTAVIAHPGVDAEARDLVSALESLFQAQKVIAAAVAQGLGVDPEAPGVMPRLIRGVTPMVTAAWRSEGRVDHDALAALALRVASFSENMGLNGPLPLEVSQHVRVDRSMAIYSSALRIARGVDEMMSTEEYQALSPMLRLILTGGASRDALMQHGCEIAIRLADGLTDRLIENNAPTGVPDQDRQIVFRASLRVVSQFAESILEYEGIPALMDFIRNEMESMKEKNVPFDQVYPQGGFSAWLERRIGDRLEGVPALDVSFRAQSQAHDLSP